jgi:hypothetical protein
VAGDDYDRGPIRMVATGDRKPDNGCSAGNDTTGGYAATEAYAGHSLGDGERNPIETPKPQEDFFAPARRPNGWRGQCGAKTRSGEPCRRPPLAGRTRCRLHGGKSLAGIASPCFKHGRRSKYLKHLPKELRAHHTEARADPQLLSLREDIALLAARIIVLLRSLSAVKAPSRWRVVKTLDALVEAVGTRDPAQIDAALAAHAKLVRTGAEAADAQEKVWREIRKVIQTKARACAVEWKRMALLREFLTREEALTFVAAFLGAAREVVTDPATLRQLQERTLHLLPPPEDK